MFEVSEYSLIPKFFFNLNFKYRYRAYSIKISSMSTNDLSGCTTYSHLSFDNLNVSTISSFDLNSVKKYLFMYLKIKK